VGDGRLRKEVLINGVKRRVGDLSGQINVVLFLPQDLTLIEGSPSDRRRYLDLALGQVDPTYAFALAEYNKVLTQRNALLKQLQDRGGPDSQLEFWDERLCEHGALIFSARAAALADLETLASALHRDLTRGADGLRLAYHPAYDPAAAPEGQLGLPLDVPVHRVGLPATEVQAGLRDKLRATRAEEIARGQTLSGPHRDEVRFLANGIDLGTYGSRGQARTAVLALKLAEVEWMRVKTGEWPVLLLDEVLAELDVNRRRELLARLGAAQQCVLTTTDLSLFPPEFVAGATVWQVEGGRIEERV
jgi:DNA replication and repair protein RecF